MWWVNKDLGGQPIGQSKHAKIFFGLTFFTTNTDNFLVAIKQCPATGFH